MKTRKAACYVSLVLALAGLSWFLLHRSEVPDDGANASRPSRPTGSSSENSSSGDSPHLATNNGPRDKALAAGPIRKEEFRRFFLPPLRFEDATLEQAIAKLTDAYRQVATATGAEFPADLHIDLSSARSDQHLTCTTPRATVPMVLHFIAAQFGNTTTGELPDFRLVALDDTPNQSGSAKFPMNATDLLLRVRDAQKLREQASDPFAPAEDSSPGALKLPALAQGAPDPFAPSEANIELKVNIIRTIDIKDLLASFGIGLSKDSSFDCNFDSISYRNFSEADVSKLQSALDIGQGNDFGADHADLNLKIISGSESIALSNGSASLTNADFSDVMRTYSETKGTVLHTLPTAKAAFDETATIDNTIQATNSDGETTWSGERLSFSSSPLGLGHETTVNYESRSEDSEPIAIQQKIDIPDNGVGLTSIHLANGKVVVLASQAALTNASGVRVSLPHP